MQLVVSTLHRTVSPSGKYPNVVTLMEPEFGVLVLSMEDIASVVNMFEKAATEGAEIRSVL